MRTLYYKTTILLAAGLLVAMGGLAQAFPAYGGGCVGCHTAPGGSLSASPDPVEVAINDSGMLTFTVTSLGGSSETALSVQGLEDSLLDFSLGAGGGNWTWTAGFAGSSYVSDFITSTGDYVLDLGIGGLATEGNYPITVMYAGNGAKGTLSGFDLTVLGEVIPEPTSVALILSGLCAVGLAFGRRNRKGTE